MSPDKFNEQLGIVLRDLRNARGWTQTEFSELAGLSRGSIANIETGRQTVSAHQAHILAKALRLRSVDELFPVIALDEDEDNIEIYTLQSPDLNLSPTQLKQVQALAHSAN